MDLTEVDYQDVLEESKEIIEKCLKKYRLDEIFLSFNGGKDCTVLLDVTLAIIKEMFGEDKVKNLQVIYIRTYNPFGELEEFIHKAETSYGLTLSIVDGGMKESLQKILNENSQFKACLMGTRKTDPFSSQLKHFQKTDNDWPQIMRVSPLLNWSYHQIWSYLLRTKVAYCDLYDKGYTSIGSTLNTIPNPSLKYVDANRVEKYNPAYLLTDETHERNGRIANNNIVNGVPSTSAAV